VGWPATGWERDDCEVAVGVVPIVVVVGEDEEPGREQALINTPITTKPSILCIKNQRFFPGFCLTGTSTQVCSKIFATNSITIELTQYNRFYYL
jgi:hypothetical protein